MTAPFVIRFRTYGEAGLMPASLLKGLDALPNFSNWSKTVSETESVTYIFDKQKIVKNTADRLAKMKAEAK